jgi:5'-nucleotidase
LEYINPVLKANEVSERLKKKEKCDVIICLSHLGADSTKMEVNDYEIAHKTRFIDVIIGGHSHSLITNTTVKNADGKPIVIAQMGKSGFYLGRIDLELEKK